MKLLVTGGSGYVGCKLVPALLLNRHQVRVVDSVSPEFQSALFSDILSNFEFIDADITEKAALSRCLKGVEAVIHLAASTLTGNESQVAARCVHQTNYLATRKLVNLCKERQTRRFIFSSTTSNYGLGDATRYATEEDPQEPTSPYGESKVRAEEYILASADATFNPTVLRLATVFGASPRMNFQSLLNSLVHDAVSQGSVLLLSSHSWRPFVHVDDVVGAVLAVLKAPLDMVSGQVFNVGSNSLNYQKGQLVDLIKKYLPETDIETIAARSDPRSYKVSFDKMANTLGFHASKTIEDGIVEVIEVLRRNLPHGISGKGNSGSKGTPRTLPPQVAQGR